MLYSYRTQFCIDSDRYFMYANTSNFTNIYQFSLWHEITCLGYVRLCPFTITFSRLLYQYVEVYVYPHLHLCTYIHISFNLSTHCKQCLRHTQQNIIECHIHWLSLGVLSSVINIVSNHKYTWICYCYDRRSSSSLSVIVIVRLQAIYTSKSYTHTLPLSLSILIYSNQLMSVSNVWLCALLLLVSHQVTLIALFPRCA